MAKYEVVTQKAIVVKTKDYDTAIAAAKKASTDEQVTIYTIERGGWRDYTAKVVLAIYQGGKDVTDEVFKSWSVKVVK